MQSNIFCYYSKIFHLKAIELVGKYVSSSSQYINHLILSFNKNYKSFMDAIVFYLIIKELIIFNYRK
jgi:hypothetical protein